MGNTYCIFSALYAPHVGGVENYTYNLARELTTAGNRVVVVANNTEGAAPHQVTSVSDVYRLPCKPLMNGRFPVPTRGRAYDELWRAIRDKDVDYVVVNTRFYPLSEAGVAFARNRGITPIVIDHGSAHLTAGSALADVGIRRVEHIMTNRLRKYDARYYGVSQKSVEWLRHFSIKAKGVLNNAIDAPAFRNATSQRDFRTELGLNDDAFVVTFTGRLEPEKGVMPLAHTAAILANENVHVLMAGDGSLRTSVEAETTSNLYLLGALEGADVSALLQQSDAFCLPTRSEGFSTSLLEAAACGTAPVVTDVGGVAELVPSAEFGRVLASREPEAIAKALRELASDRDLCAAMGASVRDRVERCFTWEETARKTMEACKAAQRNEG